MWRGLATFACFVCPALRFRETEPPCVFVHLVDGGCMGGSCEIFACLGYTSMWTVMMSSCEIAEEEALELLD